MSRGSRDAGDLPAETTTMREDELVQLRIAKQAIARAWNSAEEFEKAALWIVHGVINDLLARYGKLEHGGLRILEVVSPVPAVEQAQAPEAGNRSGPIPD